MKKRGGGKCLDFELLFSVLFFMKENRFFAADLMRNEKERKKQKQSREEEKEKKKRVHFLSHTHLKEPQHKTTEREDDFYDDIDDDQNGFNTTTKIFVFSFLFLPKL